MINLRIESLFKGKVGENGISLETEGYYTSSRNEISHQLKNRVQAKEFGFINILEDGGELPKIKEYFAENKWIKTMVVIGIGGSDLGGRVIRQALARETISQQPGIDVVFHGDSPDPSDITWIMDRIDPKSTVFNIISKSGKTIEIISQYLFWKRELKKATGEDWKQHFVFTTSSESGFLSEEASRNSITTFNIPKDVGGRYSVLTAVGLVAAVALGVDTEQLLDGAREQVRKFIEDPGESPSLLIGWSQFLLYQQGLKSVVLMPYSTRLYEFARWFRQLWAESLGKNGKGMLPIQARGPADQHSQLQLYLDGDVSASFWLLDVKNHSHNYIITQVESEEFGFLEGKSFSDILQAEMQATSKTLIDTGLPTAVIELDQVNEFNLGGLFMIFELAVVVLAEFMEVNAFDQPAVESNKKLIASLLGE